MAAKDYINPAKPKGLMVIALILTGVLVGGPLIMNITVPGDLEQYNNGFEALTAYLTADNPVSQTGALFQYFLIPLLVVWTLIYAVLDGGAGRMFSQEIMAPLAAVFAFSTLFSNYYLTLVGFINFFGSTGLILFALVGLGIGVLMTGEEWLYERREQKRFTQRDKNLEKKEKKIDKEIQELIEKVVNSSSLNFPTTTFEATIQEIEQTSISNPSTLNKLVPKLGGPQSSWDSELNKLNRLAQRKKQLADKFEKIEKEMMEEGEKHVKEE